MKNRNGLVLFILLSLLFISTTWWATVLAEQPEKGKAEVFAAINGTVGAGIIFDNRGNMFVGKNGALLKITPDGKTTCFCSLADLPKGKDYYFSSPLIWDMAIDKDGHIIAAAQDRILKINADGAVTTLIQEDFDGFVGASGLAFDKNGNMYVTSGSKILKYDAHMKKSIFIEAAKNKVKLKWKGREFDLELNSFVSLAFDPGYQNLYVSDLDSNTLLKYPILASGKPGKPIILFDAYNDDLFQAPLNVLFGEKGNIYIAHDLSSQILKIDAQGKKGIIPMEGKIKNHWIAFGGKGFDQECIYFTTYSGDYVYKTYVGEKSVDLTQKY